MAKNAHNALTNLKKCTNMPIVKTPNGTLYSGFKEEYVSQVATWLLEEWRATEEDLVRETDTSYTRGTARFGRQKERISLEYISRRHSWLKVENNGLDIVFSICEIPCRFSNDDSNAPKKRAVLEVHPFQMSLLEEAEPGEAARFVFVIDPGFVEAGDPRVSLLGFSSSGHEVCRWVSGGLVRTLTDVRDSVPAAVDVARPVVVPKRPASDNDAIASSGP